MDIITYPHSSPIILTDGDFVAYGGETGTSTVAQRQAAYLGAEKRVTAFLGTFLLPTTVTGTHAIDPTRNLQTKYGYVHSINSVIVRSRQFDADCTLRDTSICAYIRNDGYGIIDPTCVFSYCPCTGVGDNYQIQISYTAGLPTGTITQPDYLMYLVSLADIFLKEIVGDGGNESTGDIGVQSFSTEGYSEERFPLRKTTLGSSARSNWIADGLMPLRKVKGVYL
jgi:hypothetical protein